MHPQGVRRSVHHKEETMVATSGITGFLVIGIIILIGLLF